jgi:nucleoside-diphosphate-sugar epimerase
MELEPLTDYSRYKALCEDVLLKEQSPDFVITVIRPATICGFSPRMRFDLTVNLLTNLAYNTGRITVFGGEQKRPNLHIKDMADLYTRLLEFPDDKIAGEIFNVGYENHTVMKIAQLVKETVTRIASKKIEIATIPTDDLRSYHISSEKIKQKLNFKPEHTIVDAIVDICDAFKKGKLPDPINNIRYYNVKTTKARGLK